VEWQGQRGFAIATALDLSGRVPTAARAAPQPAEPPPDLDAEIVGPPVYYYRRPAYYYGPRPYYYGYPRYWGRPYWGYRRYYPW
jgi:hypothetical protein